MALQLTSKGLPIWTLQSVPEYFKEKLLDCKDDWPWRHCVVCDASPAEKPTFKCSRCSDPSLELFDPPRYCSVTCQRVHWPIHRPDCGQAKVMAREMISNIPPNAAFDVRQYRWVMRRATALLGFGGPFAWAARQMFLHSGMPLETVRKNCVIFSMTNFKYLYNSALFLGNIKYEPRDQTEDGETEPPGHYEVRWTNEIGPTFALASGHCYLDNTHGELLSTRVPQWLYAFRQCCMAGDLHPKKAKVRLELMVNTLLTYHDTNGLLNEFKHDTFEEWELTDEPEDKYPRWDSLMGPVVNSLKIPTSRYTITD